MQAERYTQVKDKQVKGKHKWKINKWKVNTIILAVISKMPTLI